MVRRDVIKSVRAQYRKKEQQVEKQVQLESTSGTEKLESRRLSQAMPGSTRYDAETSGRESTMVKRELPPDIPVNLTIKNMPFLSS